MDKKQIGTGTIGLIIGAASVYLLAPQKEVEKRVEVEKIVEVEKVVVQIKEVEKRVAANITVNRKVTETRPDGAVIVTEEKTEDKTLSTENDKTVVVASEEVKIKESMTTVETSKPVFKPFEIILVTSVTKPSVDNTTVLVGAQPISRIPIALFVGTRVNSFQPTIGFSFRF